MTHRQQKYRTRHPLLRWLAVLLALGILLVAVFFRSRIARAQYPCRYADTVTRYAELYDLDPLVLYAFIRTESNFNPNAQSDAGARGLMQITEVTFDWIKLKIAPDEALTFDDLFDPETNIRFGSYFVAYCLQRYGGRRRPCHGSRRLPQRRGYGGRTSGGQCLLARRADAVALPVPADAAVCTQDHRSLPTVSRDLL